MISPAIPNSSESELTRFQWEPQPCADRFVYSLLEEFLNRTPYARKLAARMKEETGTRFVDWVESFTLPQSKEAELAAAGFTPWPQEGASAFVHTGGMFPTMIVGPKDRLAVTIRVESVADFASAMELSLMTDDEPLSPCRRTLVSTGDEAELWAAERHGYRGFASASADAEQRIRGLHHLEQFRTRRREFASDAEGFDHAFKLIDRAIGDLGVDLTCDLFFCAEREFWQRRNRAARVQKARQDRLGLGWANHDHHTYRSSRANFAQLISILERLGLFCRERFYAGAQAGWGAQVMEQPNARIVVFADVDLGPDELLMDFSHEGLPPRDALGTVGLWCGLHGEAFLQAGMHHLECQFDFESLREQLASEAGVKVMKPFTDFPFLRQAFTEGEVWPVRPERIARLLDHGLITPAQAVHFAEHGAIGSHLENLERNEGFKGFNQTGVSDIIHRTDPRASVT